MITIITGSRGVGKTTFLLKLIKELKSSGTSISGIITPAIYNEDRNRVGFYALNVANGEQWELGRSDKLLKGPSYGPFSFSERGFAKANIILERVLTNGSAEVFIDEIGPLELEKGYGFLSVLSFINRFSQDHNLYLVIRQSLIDEFVSEYISSAEYRIVEITTNNRDDTKI